MKQVFDLLPVIKKAYQSDDNYFVGEIAGEHFKIRMNKNHARNIGNDDQGMHNLSLISENIASARVFRKASGKLQWQIENVKYWEQAEEQIIEFLGAILDSVE